MNRKSTKVFSVAVFLMTALFIGTGCAKSSYSGPDEIEKTAEIKRRENAIVISSSDAEEVFYQADRPVYFLIGKAGDELYFYASVPIDDGGAIVSFKRGGGSESFREICRFSKPETLYVFPDEMFILDHKLYLKLIDPIENSGASYVFAEISLDNGTRRDLIRPKMQHSIYTRFSVISDRYVVYDEDTDDGRALFLYDVKNGNSEKIAETQATYSDNGLISGEVLLASGSLSDGGVYYETVSLNQETVAEAKGASIFYYDFGEKKSRLVMSTDLMGNTLTGDSDTIFFSKFNSETPIIPGRVFFLDQNTATELTVDTMSANWSRIKKVNTSEYYGEAYGRLYLIKATDGSYTVYKPDNKNDRICLLSSQDRTAVLLENGTAYLIHLPESGH